MLTAGICPAAAWRPARRFSTRWRANSPRKGNIQLGASPQLFGIYFNKRASRRDHVALFIVRDFRQDGDPRPNREIVAHGFFRRNALPDDTGRGTRARIAEVFGDAPVSEFW